MNTNRNAGSRASSAMHHDRDISCPNMLQRFYNDKEVNKNIRPYRLMVRTSGFHPGNRGSIPRRVMNKKTRSAEAERVVQDVLMHQRS